jgi:peptidyl-prolyl cis-trans isomerase C
MNRKVMLGWMGAVFVAGGLLGFGAGRLIGRAGESFWGGPSRGEALVVATYAGGTISTDELQARMAEEGPLMRQRYTTPEGKQELLWRIVRERVLASDARSKGYDREPRVVRQCEGSLVGLYLEKELEAPERERSIPGAELRAFFEQHRDEYAQPARARIAHLLLEASEDEPARRDNQRAVATTLLSQLRAQLKKDPDAFATLARGRSEDAATRPFGGELPVMTEAQLREVLGAEPTARVFDTSAQRGLLEQVIETPRGFHLVRVIEREPAVTPDFEVLRETLRTRYQQVRRDTRKAEFMAAVEQRAQLQVERAALDAVSPPAQVRAP